MNIVNIRLLARQRSECDSTGRHAVPVVLRRHHHVGLVKARESVRRAVVESVNSVEAACNALIVGDCEITRSELAISQYYNMVTAEASL